MIVTLSFVFVHMITRQHKGIVSVLLMCTYSKVFSSTCLTHATTTSSFGCLSFLTLYGVWSHFVIVCFKFYPLDAPASLPDPLQVLRQKPPATVIKLCGLERAH